MEPAALSFHSAMNILSKSVNQFTPNRDRYLQAVDRIQQSVVVVVAEVNNPISHDVTRLKDEFYGILTRQTKLPLNSSSIVQSSSITDSTIDEYFMADDGLSTEAISDLRRIVVAMNSVGYLRDCVELYKCVRKPFVDTHFRRLGIDNFSVADAKVIELDDLKKKIDRWITAARVCIRILFKREKRVYEQIFNGIGTTTYEACFLGIVKDASIQLFSFAEAVSTTPRSPNKLFMILDFYNALSDLSVDIGSLFRLESAKSIRIDTRLLLSRLEVMVGRTLSDFEYSLVHEVSTIAEPGGIHRSTKFVMDYVSRILKHQKTLSRFIVSNPSTSFGDLVIPDVEFVRLEGQTPLGLHLILLIVVLRFNLECKFKNYEDPSQFHLFMMNNVHYIVQQIKGYPELRKIVGEDYLNRLTEKVRLEMNGGQKLICDKISYCLRDEGLRGTWFSSSRVSKGVVRERIKMFNARVEEVQRTQATWVVPDVQLRDELRNSISVKLVPAYKSFLDRYANNIENRRHPNIIKYSVDDLGNFISKNFLS